MADGVGVALLKFMLGIAEKVAGSAITSGMRWLVGKEVLVVGQARGGKTSFRNYLRYGLLEDERDTPKTHDETRMGSFEVGLGRDKELKLICSSLTELPGQEGPVAHANTARQKRPHGLIIVSDLTATLTGQPERAAGAWLEEFCDRMEANWRGAKANSNRLQSMILVLNKRDKVNDEAYGKRANALRKILESRLNISLGTMKARVEVLPCVSVTNPDGPKLIDAVVSHLAKALAGEQ